MANERHTFSIGPDQARRHLELLAQAGAVLSRSLERLVRSRATDASSIASERCRRGFDEHLVKPIVPARLLDVIETPVGAGA